MFKEEDLIELNSRFYTNCKPLSRIFTLLTVPTLLFILVILCYFQVLPLKVEIHSVILIGAIYFIYLFFIRHNAYFVACKFRTLYADLQIASDGYDAWNSLVKPSFGQIERIEKIQVQTFDSFIKNVQNVSKISLIKIDVEGWEIPVLEGGEAFFKEQNAPTLLIEFTEQNAKNAGYTCKGLYNKLVSFGYTIYYYNAQKNTIVKDEIREDYTYINLIASKNYFEVIERLI